MHRVEAPGDELLEAGDDLGPGRDRVLGQMWMGAVAAPPGDHDLELVRGRVDRADPDGHRAGGHCRLYVHGDEGGDVVVIEDPWR
jgi:hypothetical protein